MAHPMLTQEQLLSVRKPARYIGGEINSITKDLSQMAVKVCLCFPDIYEIGMSHLGLRILYDIINKEVDCAAERVFSPWADMDDLLKSSGTALFSLESQVPVKSFDILGFSIQYELSFTNVLNVLSLSHIPLRSSERSSQDPLVIAGGSSCLNPGPIADFVDCFVMGEAEELILELIAVYKKYKSGELKSRSDLFKELSLIEGVYVPSITSNDASLRIHKRIVRDLEKVLCIDRWVVPYIEIIHDRVGIEIMRGCPNRCRFCQARSTFYPWRLLSAKKILEIIRSLYDKTGYEEVSLLSLSSSDHPELEHMVKSLMEEFKAKGVSISMPSLRAKHMVGALAQMLSTMKKTSLTFAPEAGSARLRRVIGKDIDMDELFGVAREAFGAGYRLLKLYFMIGLPTETTQDLDQIADICARLLSIKRQVDGSRAELNVTISNFIPKPHTPFAWQPMASEQELKDKQNYLRDIFRKYRGSIHLKFHDARMSFLEGILSRGDRRLVSVVESAFKKGAKFDAWDEFFNRNLWLEAFSQNGIDPYGYLKAKGYDEKLPWDFIDVGISREMLISEAQKALTT